MRSARRNVVPENWVSLALCRSPGDPDMWWTEELSREAVHQCLAHCPVLEQCREQAVAERPYGCVQGGIKWVAQNRGYARGKPGLYRAHPVSCDECKIKVRNPCPYCTEEVKPAKVHHHPECRELHLLDIDLVKETCEPKETPREEVVSSTVRRTGGLDPGL